MKFSRIIVIFTILYSSYMLGGQPQVAPKMTPAQQPKVQPQAVPKAAPAPVAQQPKSQPPQSIPLANKKIAYLYFQTGGKTATADAPLNDIGICNDGSVPNMDNTTYPCPNYQSTISLSQYLALGKPLIATCDQNGFSIYPWNSNPFDPNSKHLWQQNEPEFSCVGWVVSSIPNNLRYMVPCGQPIIITNAS